MSKKIKMMLYTKPGVGKSVFASKFPKPFFISTDGNFEWLLDFGLKIEDHKQVTNYDEFYKTINNHELFKDYDTIVVDLLEDTYEWCERGYVETKGIEDISDIGYGKGHKIVRADFRNDINNLISMDKHIIFLCHESHKKEKNGRGVEYTEYYPSDLIPTKVLTKIIGRLRYVLRGYMEDTIVGDSTVQKRMLSLVPKSYEIHGAHRGADIYTLPQDIPLDVDAFFKAIGFNPNEKSVAKEVVKEVKSIPVKKEVEEVKEVTATESKPLSLKERLAAKKKASVEPVIEEPTLTADDEEFTVIDDLVETTEIVEDTEVQEEIVEVESKPLSLKERLAAKKKASVEPVIEEVPVIEKKESNIDSKAARIANIKATLAANKK